GFIIFPKGLDEPFGLGYFIPEEIRYERKWHSQA
ncbi:MAG: hypothetical protein JWM04_2443, partial [Verrucomicrobiales bacterium]|nr:hypothetical protein [Verrucomicrobiales bacterium]